MPIYEFACHDCRTVFQFFSRRVDTSTVPGCPKCGRPLSKQMSLFRAKSGGGSNPDPFGLEGDGCDDDTSGAPDFDVSDERIAGAIDELGSKIDNMDDTDASGAAKLMREFSRKSGVKFKKSVEDALGRIEGGEDADKVVADIGDDLENPFDAQGASSGSSASVAEPYARDPTLHDMPTESAAQDGDA